MTFSYKSIISSVEVYDKQAQWMIYEQGLIKGIIWKMTYCDMFIIYFNRGNNRISAIFMTRTSSSKADHAGKKVELGSSY
jgi:hypothetical protein